MLNSFFLIFSSVASLALSPSPQPLIVQSGELTLRGQRYVSSEGQVNAGKPRVLFTHGLTSNFHEFEKVSAAVLSSGYDGYAFNFSGHGNGLERSELSKYNNGDYSFEKMAERDFPLMLEYVSERGKYPVIVIGHSMGGMIPRASIAGGFVDPALISRMVLIGSPSTFDQNAMPWEILDPLSISELPLWLGQGDRPVLGSGIVSIGVGLMALTGNPIMDWLARGVVRRENMGSADEWKERAFSNNVPKDIFRSFANFRSVRFKHEHAPLPVPALHILGSDDRLAPWREVINKGMIQSKDSQAWFLLLDRVSHIDLVAEKPLKAYSDILLRFLNSPDSLGANHGFLRRALDCESALAFALE